jgi:hypothetical protein
MRLVSIILPSAESYIRTHGINRLFNLLSSSSDICAALSVVIIIVGVLPQLVEGRLHVRNLVRALTVVRVEALVRRNVTHGSNRGNNTSTSIDECLQGSGSISLVPSRPVVVTKLRGVRVLSTLRVAHQLALDSNVLVHVVNRMCLRVLGDTVVATSSIGCSDWCRGHLHLKVALIRSTAHEVHSIFNEVLLPELVIALVSQASESSLVSLVMPGIILVLSCGESILGRVRSNLAVDGVISLSLALLKVDVF